MTSYPSSHIHSTHSGSTDLRTSNPNPSFADLALLRLAQEADQLHPGFPGRGQVLRALASNPSARDIVAPFLRSEHQHAVRRAGRTEQRRRDPLRGLRSGVDSWFGTILLADLSFDNEGRRGLLQLHLNEQRQRRLAIDNLSLELLRGKLDKRAERRNRTVRTKRLNRSGRIRDARKTRGAVLRSFLNLPSLYADKAEAALGRRKSGRIDGGNVRNLEKRGRSRRGHIGPPKRAGLPTCGKCCPSSIPLRNEHRICHEVGQMHVRNQKRKFAIRSGTEIGNTELVAKDTNNLRSPQVTEILTSAEQGAKREAERQAALAALESRKPVPNYSRKLQPNPSITTAPLYPIDLNKSLPPLPGKHKPILAHPPAPSSLYTAEMQYFLDSLSSRSQENDKPTPIGWWQQEERHGPWYTGGYFPRESLHRGGTFPRGEGRHVLWHDE